MEKGKERLVEIISKNRSGDRHPRLCERSCLAILASWCEGKISGRLYAFALASTLVSISLSGCALLLPFSDNNIYIYPRLRETLPAAEEILPELDRLHGYRNISFLYQSHPMLLFVSRTIYLVVEYDKESYRKEKAEVVSGLAVPEPRLKDSFGHICIDEVEFTINSYRFFVMKTPGSRYPKHFGLRAFSDEKRSIAYLYFDDVDQDVVSDPTSDFVKEYFSYNW